MKNPSTGREAQRTDFVESLYNSLRKQTKVAIDNQQKLISLAKSYLQDGLEPHECVELLMIDGGLPRKAAEGYLAMVKNSSQELENDEGSDYSFQFEDSRGNVLSSFDIGKIVTASNAVEAMEKADTLMQSYDEVTILNVSRIPDAE